MHFENIHAFTYQKTFLHALLLKLSKAFIVSLNNFASLFQSKIISYIKKLNVCIAKQWTGLYFICIATECSFELTSA